MQKPLFFLLLATVSAATLFTQADAKTNSLRGCANFICANEPQLSPDRVVAFWTNKRMKEAWPSFNTPGLPLEPPLDPDADSSGYTLMSEPYEDHPLSRMNGILFFHEIDGGEEHVRHCSASVIKSGSQDLILTAAHCIRNADGWRDMLMFVPGYRETETGLKVPLGKWPVYQAFYPSAYMSGNPENDIAVARVYSNTAPIGPQITLQQAVGGGFAPYTSSASETFPRLKLIGYPSVSPNYDYHTAKQRQCDSNTKPSDDYPTAITLLNCAMQGGNSGGPLIVREARVDMVVGVGVMTAAITGQARLMPQNF